MTVVRMCPSWPVGRRVHAMDACARSERPACQRGALRDLDECSVRVAHEGIADGVAQLDRRAAFGAAALEDAMVLGDTIPNLHGDVAKARGPPFVAALDLALRRHDQQRVAAAVDS